MKMSEIKLDKCRAMARITYNGKLLAFEKLSDFLEIYRQVFEAYDMLEYIYSSASIIKRELEVLGYDTMYDILLANLYANCKVFDIDDTEAVRLKDLYYNHIKNDIYSKDGIVINVRNLMYDEYEDDFKSIVEMVTLYIKKFIIYDGGSVKYKEVMESFNEYNRAIALNEDDYMIGIQRMKLSEFCGPRHYSMTNDVIIISEDTTKLKSDSLLITSMFIDVDMKGYIPEFLEVLYGKNCSYTLGDKKLKINKEHLRNMLDAIIQLSNDILNSNIADIKTKFELIRLDDTSKFFIALYDAEYDFNTIGRFSAGLEFLNRDDWSFKCDKLKVDIKTFNNRVISLGKQADIEVIYQWNNDICYRIIDKESSLITYLSNLEFEFIYETHNL